jgi:hypothetical protein
MLLETAEDDLTSQEENGADVFIAHLVDLENFYLKISKSPFIELLGQHSSLFTKCRAAS